MNENYDDCHYRKPTSTFILYTQKVKIITECFIYKKPDTFQKARQFPLSFYIQKAIHLTLLDSHENFELGIYIQNA